MNIQTIKPILLLKIFDFCTVKELINVRQTCQQFKRISDKSRVWFEYLKFIQKPHLERTTSLTLSNTNTNTNLQEKDVQDLVPNEEYEINMVYQKRINWFAVCVSEKKTQKNWKEGTYEIVSIEAKGGVRCLTIEEDLLLFGTDENFVSVYDLAQQKPEYKGTFSGHKGWVECIDMDFDSLTAVSGGWDSTVCVWDLEKAKLKYKLKGHKDRVVCLKMNEKYIVSGDWRGELIVWDKENGKRLHKLHNHTNSIFALELEKNIAITSSADKTIKIFDIEKGELKTTLTGHKNWVVTVKKVNPLSSTHNIVSGGWDGVTRVWDIENEKSFGSTGGHTDSITCLEVLNPYNNPVFLTGSVDHLIKKWDLRSGRVVQTFYGHRSPVKCLSVTPSLNTVVSSGDVKDSSVYFWDFRTGKLLYSKYQHRENTEITSMKVDNEKVITGSNDGTVKIWNFRI
ncbi:f-box and wd repeat-containing protein [Anaeramoeba ignava]|uniref:F-box and wd repeat-containing protein n=1 Tax=Anaeramoeba ignava TaxID=1746090 RepID=A0A9Q0LFC2_ANAIG|nr:f-box and wd repeat-containing protein [Anaeramoeba ignava]|eukprot:Anaeramoba_ignava/a2653_28.p1 GENE.a2653_28~~a2653_28.p1  ORF type:complete len:454 (-),score=130.09 a2653_28:121-1482(-)